MDNSPTYYNAEMVASVLNWPMVIEAVEISLKAVVAPSDRNPSVLPPPSQNHRNPQGDAPAAASDIEAALVAARSSGAYANQPQRSITYAGNNSSGLLLSMPVFVGNYSLTTNGSGGDAANLPRQSLVCKLVTSFSGNAALQPPLPSIMAHIVLFNSQTGALESIMAGTDITNWRTAAASLLATRYLYFRRFGLRAEQEREIDVAIVGCGAQGQLHATAMCANFKVRRLSLWNRNPAKAQQLAARLRMEMGRRTQIDVCSSARAAVESADVICIATFASEAVICADDLRKKRAIHINAVGAGEVHFGELAKDIYEEAEIYVDCMANAAAELQGLPAHIVGEVGEVIINGNYPAEGALTIFQSMGMAAEDACVAQAVHEALSSGIK